MNIRWTPAQLLMTALLASIVVCVAATWLALQPPWLGLQLNAAEQSEGLLVASPGQGPSTGVPAGVRLTRLHPLNRPAGTNDEGIVLRHDDLIEEPDFFDSYAQMRDFYARQSRLDMLLHDTVQLVWRDADGKEAILPVTPAARPLATLPAVFWFQLFAGCLGFLIAAWVFALRPDDWGARMFALTGLMFPFFTVPAAIYSARELALDGTTFRTLASLNHFGAFMFGCALVGIFLCYPKRLVRPRTLLWLPAVFGLWLASDVLQLAPDQDLGSRLPVMAEMLLAIVFAAVQWRRSRREPVDRAALRWFILSAVLGCGLFVFTTAGASMLGLFPPLSQGYSFGYFLIMYLGLALGLRRYRLFDLDEWAYRILLWVAGAALVIAMDALLMLGLGLDRNLSLGATLFICGWLYFPLRQWLWGKLVGKRATSFDAVLPELNRIAFSASAEEREHLWTELLRRVYDPLTLDTCAAPSQAGVAADGLVLLVPACDNLAARSLRYAHGGRRLFSTKDVAFLASLCHLMNEASSGREAYERGVVQERQRIARDMHDDIGARLLMLTHRLRDPKDADIARAAIQDLRTTLGALDAHAVPLADALADWRVEIESRCEAADVTPIWRQPADTPGRLLAPREKATLERVLREAVSNALKHAAPRSVTVEVAFHNGLIQIAVEDDGNSPHTEHWSELEGQVGSYGLGNIRSRLVELGGELKIAQGASAGTRLAMTLPLQGSP